MTEDAPSTAAKVINGVRCCAFGYCRAPLVQRGRSLYCSDEHVRAAQSRMTVEAVARRAAEAEYQRISRGERRPEQHLGWLTTTDGVVLDGHTVLELRALIDQHRRAVGELVALVRRPGATAQSLQGQLDDAVLPLDRNLLAVLHRVLTQPRPLD
ncbi:hypothetical protein ACI78R_07885 [Geodermatophilus sp. SYSU D01106]